MGERFSTPEEVREHWLGGGDTYRVSETKAEADQRRAVARSRADRSLDEELVGEALVIARIQRTTLPAPDQYRWGVFHAGTALLVRMMESAQGADQARALAEAIDAWRDPESSEPFDWDSDGLSDRLRSPYGRGMLDQVRGREPGERWAEPPPAETETYETDDGQAYAYAKVDRELRVFAPGGLLIARAASRFDVNTKKDAWIGEMRDGRRLAGKWESHFVEHSVQQHLIAQREPSDRDKLWIHYTADRAMVHGSDRYDTDLKKVMRSAGFTWSGNAQAYVTAGTTRPVARAQSVDRLARALYEEGRVVEIRADEDRLRGILAPAASGPAVAAAGPAPASSPAPAPAPEPVPVLVPQDLTDDLLAAELARLARERDAAVYGGTRRRRLDEQLAPLTEEHRRRVVVSYRDRADPAGMAEEELTTERDQLAQILRIPSYGHDPVREAQQERADLLDAEHGRRLAVDYEARPPVLQMTDDDLRAEGEILAKGRYGTHPGAAREAFDVRREAVGVEIADRHLRTWEPEQVHVGDLDDIELTEAIEALRTERLYDTAFAGHYASMQRIEKAHGARLEVLRDEQKKRDTTAFEAMLKADSRIRLESRSYTSGVRDDDVRVFIDGRRYGDLTEAYPGWKASILLGRGTQNNTTWRTEALTWLIEQYEASPQTRDTRTWGPVVDVELPPSLVEHLITRNSEYTGTDEAEKYLLDRLVNSSRTQSWDETGKKVMVHALDLPERTLPVLERMGRLLVAELDEELDSDDRKTKERAKRSRPNVLRGLDDIREIMRARGLEPLTDAAASAPQDGETDGERVRADGPTSLDDVPAPGTGPDAGPGGVLRGAGGGGAGEDRGADAGADGRSDAGTGSRAAGGEAEGRAADGEGAGTSGDRAGGAGGGEPGRGAAPVAARFRPFSQEDLAPAGERAKAHANLAAVRTLKQVQAEERPATPEEQQVLARWSGWGSVPDVFAARPQQDDPVFGPGGEREGGYAAAAARWEALADVRDPLRELLDDAEWRAAAASTLSAHYTPPEVTAALWQALADLGFDGGEVLEPGSGAGVTFGTAPDTARLTGVEIDPTSAAISRLLAPGVTVLNESFADTIAPDGAFDAVVGNVPFARLTLFDPKYNKARHRIHNHFLVKSVALTRPGGVVVLITSRHTMDAEGDAARRELFESADLLGAVRLPNKAFARSAGTDVVTDVLILRRRAEDETPGDAGWVTSTRRDLDGHTLPVSDYFTAHPEHVLGSLTSRMGAYGPEVAVDGDPDVAVALNTALQQITDKAVLDRRWYQPHPDGPHRPGMRLRPAASVTDFTGRLSADADGKLWQANSNGDPIAIELPEAEHAQLTVLIELKDLVCGLNDLDRRGTDTGLAAAQRRTTKAAYQRYVDEYGALTRPRQQQNATVKSDDGTERKRLTGYGYFLNDPSAYEVLALEWWEADTGTVHVSQLLERAPATRRSVLGQHTDDPQQALTAVVAERGHVDLDHIAWMLQVEPAEARRLLARSVFTDPLTGDLIHSPDYLSGDVRTKLAIARQAARRDRAYETNVAELERVQPRELLPGQFAIRLGAAWIPDDMVQDFLRGYLGDAHLTIQHSGGGNWHILKGRNLAEENELRHSAGGLAPLAMVSKVLNGGAMTGRPADDEDAARAVRVKADEFRDAFEAWVLDDSLRAARIAEVYNERQNARAVRDFTGSAPSLAGLDPDFTPYDHQLAAAARMAHERCLVLAHEVGAGKTATMTIGMMAMRNTGQINKPLVTVPNYLVEQWESTVRGLFPTARILALTSADLEDGKRDRMLEYIRSNDFDLIITSHSLFDSIPLSPEFHELYNNDEARLLREQITRERKRDGKSVSLKQLEERASQFEEELKARAAAVRTPGQVYLDDLGIDFFAVDEFHEYKNLAVRSKIPGARVAGSGKAQHLHGVLEWARMNKPTGPIGVLATGTPLSNAIGELHTVVRMANPDLLRDIDAETFDAWASMYGRLVERMEMTTDGKGFKSVERFASFHNVPGLVRQLWHPLVDFKSAEELGLELPRTKGGEPELMLVPATADQLQHMQELGERYEAFHEGGVDKSIDNPLAINNDARVIAMDSRLIDADAEPSNKLVALADRIIAKYEETKDNRYTYSTTDKRPHPVPGALQFVFLNNGTPGGNNRGNLNAYQELKDLLVARGMPADKVAFIHDAERADQRIKLQHNANHGGINVLVGSTKRMGKGLNAQNRAVSLYHVDPDWRPSDMAQRDGRIVRNGNQNPEVEIVWMATAGTFDSRMYGLLATKAKGFNKLYKARVDVTNDEIMEVEDANLPYEEAMAIISGNPYLIEQEELRKQLRTLELDQRNRATQRAILGKRLNELRIDIENLSYDIPRRARALPLLEPVLGDDFTITLAGTQYTKHKDAAGPLMQLLTGVGQSLPAGRATTPDAKLGRLGGLGLVAVAYREDDGTVFVRLHLDGLPGIVQRSTLAELADLKGETVLRRLVKTLTDAPERQTEDEGNLAAKRTTRDQLLIDRERLRGQVPGLGRVRERKSLVDTLVAAQASLNKLGKPSDDEPASVTTSRREATARHDDLQQRLDRLAAEPAPEASTEAGAVLRDMDDGGPRPDPATYSRVQREAEAALLRAHLTVHGHDPEVAARLAALGDTTELPLPDPAPTTGPQPAPERPQTPLQGLMAGFGDRVIVGHIGGPQTAEKTAPSGDGAPAEEQTEQQLPDPEIPAAEPAPAPPAANDSDPAENDPEPDADPYGTANLFDEFGLTPPERVPAPAPQDDPAPEEPEEEAEGIPDGQMTVEEAAPVPTDPATEDQRERLTSTDGHLTFTLARVPIDDVRPETVGGYQRRRDKLAAAVETRNAQNAQSREERDEQLAKWQRSYKAANGLELWRPPPALDLTPRTDTPGLAPAEYAIGSWVTWQDTATGTQVTGQVMSPGAATNTWYVSTERTAVTGEYHVLARSGKKKTGYSYSISGATTGLRPAAGPPEPLPFESLPAVDSIPARPVTSYADHVPKDGTAMVREPVSVLVGPDELRAAEVVFPVTADHIPFVVKIDQHNESLTLLYTLRVEVDGQTVAELWKEETRAAAVDAAVRAARQSRELADKPLYARARDHRLDVAEDGVCARCNRQFDGDTGEQQLYRVDGGDPTCAQHIASSLDVAVREVEELGTARRIWAARTAPEPRPDATPARAVEPPAPEPALAPEEARLVDRATVGPGDLVSITLDGPGVVRLDREVPGAVRVTGTLYPAYREYHAGAVLLDSVLHDAEGNEVSTGADVTVQALPAQVRLTPAGHRADLRPETRTAGQIRVGDLIAEGGTRGEVVTEVSYASNPRGATGFTSRDVAKGTVNGFSLRNSEEVLVVPRERRRPKDVAEVFGRHESPTKAATQTRQTHQRHAALDQEAARLWPDGDGPQAELQALREAVAAIDAEASGRDAYRANAAAMTTAATAATALFDTVDDTIRYRGLGDPLHQLRQHLDVQIHRLHADVAHLEQRARTRAEATEAVGQEESVPDVPTASEKEAAMASPAPASTPEPSPTETEQLGLFGAEDGEPASADTAAQPVGDGPEPPQVHTAPEQGPAADGTLPTLEVEPPALDVPPLGPAEPFADDADLRADAARLHEVYERWVQLPGVQLYLQDDRVRRGEALPPAHNPVGALHTAYASARGALEGSAEISSPDVVLGRIYAVAAWSRALEPAVGEELGAPLGELSSVAHELAARSQAMIEAFAAEQSPAEAPTTLRAVAPEAVPAPQAPPVPDPAPEQVPTTQEDVVSDVIDVLDPPEPQRFSTTVPLADYDLHMLYLEGMEGGGYDRGEVRREGESIATLHRTVGGQWYARMQLDPPDITRLVDDPETAAAHGAVMYAVFTGAPLGDPVAAAPGDSVLARTDQVRSELRKFAALHALSIETAARQLSSGYAQNPHYAELAARLADVADSEGRGARMMAADLGGVERAVNEWSGKLPPSPNSGIRAALVFPLAHMLFDVRRLQARLEATVEAAAEERARQEEAAVTTKADPVAETVPDAPASAPEAQMLERRLATGWWEHSYQGRIYTSTKLPDELAKGRLATLNYIVVDENRELVARSFGAPITQVIIWAHANPGIPRPETAGWLSLGGGDPEWPEYSDEERAYVMAGPPAEQMPLDLDAGAELQFDHDPAAASAVPIAPASDGSGQRTPAEQAEDPTPTELPVRRHDVPEDPEMATPARPATPGNGETTAPAPQALPLTEAAPVEAADNQSDRGAEADAGAEAEQQTVKEQVPEVDPVGVPAVTPAPYPMADREEAVEAPEESGLTTTEAPTAVPAVTDSQVDSVPAVDVEDPPEPQPYAVVTPLPADAGYQLRLIGLDGQDPDRGELRRGDVLVAAVYLTTGGRWFARMAADGLLEDETSLEDAPQEAAACAAVMYAAFTGTPYGETPAAVVATDPQAAADVLRQELQTAAQLNRSRVTDAAARLTPHFAQMPHFQRLEAQLADMEAAAADHHDARQMAAHLGAVEQAVNEWGGAMPANPNRDERRLMAYPLAHLLYDTRRLQTRLQATVDAVRVELAARQQETPAAAETAPAAPASELETAQSPPQGAVPAAVPPAAQPSAPASADGETQMQSGAGNTGTSVSDGPADQGPAQDETAREPVGEAAPAEPSAPATITKESEIAEPVPTAAADPETEQDGAVEGESSAPEIGEIPVWLRSPKDLAAEEATKTTAAAGAGDVTAAPGPEAQQDNGQPDAVPSDEPAAAQPADPPLWKPDDLPLWKASSTAEGTGEEATASGQGEPLDVVAAFQGVQEAWAEVVPAAQGTAADLFDDVERDLRTLQQLLRDATRIAAPADGGVAETSPVRAPRPEQTGERAPEEPARIPEREALAVNTALRQADVHAPSLQDLPEWQRLQTLRGAFGNLWSVVKKRAGEHFDRLVGDGRVSEFFRKVSVRACEKVAEWAHAGADRLRRDYERGPGQNENVPSAAALGHLGDAALSYSAPHGGRGSTPPSPPGEAPGGLDIPAMRRMGEALARPMPGAGPQVSASAARGRSTTAKRPAKKPAQGSTEQAGHLRRGGGPEQPQSRKPQR